ncbi:hypothetical protein BB559_002952 [Furculomyces boomerangus]|uniref:U3 small nucleolar RNA-associated protein 25 n=1 Tax=Furculomyces boomerangus TaxID=61424 RepID=A0A2T9YQJ6_9FUNG|nr:hypothetical protein BB559_002952 [Furculomyces boomerangus]
MVKKSGNRQTYTRRELNQLKEYGQLDPTSLKGSENDLEEAISRAINKRETSRFATFTVNKKPKFEKNQKKKRNYTSYESPKESIPENDQKEEQEEDSYINLLSKLKTRNAEESLSSESDIESDTSIQDSLQEESDIGEQDSSQEKSEQEELGDSDLEPDNLIEESEQEIETKDVHSESEELEEQSEESKDDSNGVGTENDPFMRHYELVTENELAKRVSKITTAKYLVSEVDTGIGSDKQVILYSTTEEPEELPEFVHISKEKIKQRIMGNFAKENEQVITEMNTKYQNEQDFVKSQVMTDDQAQLFQYLNSHKDLLYGYRTYMNGKSLMSVYALHVLNHVLKSRDRVVKHNTRLSKANKSGKSAEENSEMQEEEYRDQGFTRPSVLVLLPYRSQAHLFINFLTKFLGTTAINLDRFNNEFGVEEEDVDQKKPGKFYTQKIGMRVTKKNIKLYSDFYLSDILVASPMGLRLVTGSEQNDSKLDYDFLSSIDMLVMDQCDALQMQNWDHVIHMFSRLNLVPKKPRDTDYSRLRSYYLDGMNKHVRQTIILSDYLTPELVNVFNRECLNYEGKIKMRRLYEGTISKVIMKPLEMKFNKIPTKSITSSNDDRFNYFVSKIFPLMKDAGTMVFIPSYFDYVRVRNFIKKHDESLGMINEYTPKPQVSRVRTLFYQGRMSTILYTERFHYYYRLKIKGTNKIIFYGLPDHPEYYPELVNLLLDSKKTSENMMNESEFGSSEPMMSLLNVGGKINVLPPITILYNKYDVLKLQRIVGEKLARKIIDSKDPFYSKF